MTKAELLSQITSLPVEDRLSIILDLESQLPLQERTTDLSPEEIGELQRRLDAYRANPQRGSSWEDVSARIRDRRRIAKAS
jgi:putative addiction module component (TIGR02574 family)